MAFTNILKRLADKQIIVPILENQMRAEKWPDRMPFEVDTSPYYGTGDGYFHPSTHALLTARQLYYEFHPDSAHLMEEEPYSFQKVMATTVGSAVHAVIQTQMKMTGLVGDDDIEVEYINEAHHVRGRADMVVHHPTEGPVLCEIKTRTSYKFGKTVAEDMDSWRAQVSLACDNLSDRYGTDFTYGIVIMAEVGWPFRVEEQRVARDDALLEQIYSKFDYVRRAVANNEPPPVCCPYDSPTMRGCHARYACWLKEVSGR